MGGGDRTALGMMVVLALAAPEVRADDDGTRCPLDRAPLPLLNFLVGEQTGLRLDLRPVGDGGVLEPLTRCPACGLVLEGVPHEPDDLPRLRRALTAPAVRAARGQGSNRFLKATTLHALQSPAEVRARAWLEAAWELEDVDEPRRRESLERALAAYAEVEALPWAPDPVGRPFRSSKEDLPRTSGLLQVELLRQLGRFGAALARLEALGSRPEFQRGLYRYLVPQERALLVNRDPRPQPIARVPAIDRREDDPEYVAARALPGWERFAREFELKRLTRGGVNGEVNSQHATIQAVNPRLVDAVWWWNPINQEGNPDLTWHELLAAHQQAELAAARHPWLQAWKAAGASYSLELQLVGSRPWTTSGGTRVAPLWRDAGLTGTPAFEFLLRVNRRARATIFLDDEGRGSLIVSTSGLRGGSHWLESVELKSGGEYGVVSPAGELQVRPAPQEPPDPAKQTLDPKWKDPLLRRAAP